MKILWIPLIFLCFLLSCASSPEKRETRMQAKPPDIPSPVSFQADKEQKTVAKQADDLYSFSLREADVKDILRAIARQTNYNVVIEPDVKGFTTVDLKQVTLPKALEYILEPLNFTFKIEDRTIYVSRPKLESKVFTINYLALKKTAVSRVTWREGGSSTTTYGTGSSASTTSSEEKSMEIKSETESDLWKSLEDNLKPLVSAEGKFSINRQAFTIMIMDYPKNLGRIEKFLQSLEGPMHRQIMIEAKVIEVILGKGSRVGIDWRLVDARVGSFAKISATQVIPTPADFATASSNIISSFVVTSPSSGEFTGILDALQQEYETQLLSSPKISTLNNQRAVIKATTQEVYYDEAISQGTLSTNTVATYTPRFINVGVVLDVTPQIDENNNIILSIHPIYSQVTSFVPSPNPQSTGRGVPVVTTREADAVVRVKDGQTVIIAGLIQTRKFRDRSGVYGLSMIPLLGPLFRQDTEEVRNTELVLFLTPKIVHPD